MAKYELTFLLNSDEDLKAVKEAVETLPAAIAKEENWGEKALAYKIKKKGTARFYRFVFECEPEKMNALRRKLDFNEKLVRYLLLDAEGAETAQVTPDKEEK